MTPNDVKIVADNIDDFIEVPDGVARLRKAVLTLAVSGKLVPQDKKEGTAESLYTQIQLDQKEEVGGRKRKINESTPSSSKDFPFDIPSSWEWVHGKDLFSVVRGVTYGKQDAKDHESAGHLPLLRSHNIQEVGLNTNDLVFVPHDKISPQQMLKRGDILIAMSSGSKNLVGKAAQAHEDMKYSYGAFCAVIRSKLPSITPYLGFFFSTPYYRDATALEGKGMSINNLTVGALENLLIPLPPLMEQERIVRRSKEVVNQLKELETKKLERDEVRTRLARSAMQSLGKGEPKIAFEQLTELIKTPSDLKELENTLLTLAVSGKLVPPELRVSVSKSKEKPTLSAIKSVSLKLPAMWGWAQFKDKNLLQIIDGDRGRNYPSKSDFSDKGYCLFLSTSNVRKGEFAFSKCDFITKEKDESLRKGKLAREDVVLTTRGTIGNTAYFSHDIPFDNVRINSGMVILRCDTTKIFPPYLIVFLKSSIFISQTNKLMSGSAQQQLPIKVLNEIYFPLPSLAEQKRIVKKVEEVMDLINRLKKVMEI